MKKNNRIRLLYLIIFLILFSAACSTDYSQAFIDEELKDTPNFILINFSETVVEKGEPVYHVTADTAETYDNRKTTIIKNLYFVEYSSSSIASEGYAGKASYFSDTDNIFFEQNFELNAVEQGFSIKGESLFWENSLRSLSGSEDGIVTIKKDDGSLITGRGFRSSASDRSFMFEKAVEGFYVSEETDENINE